jgi:hypothetical protein
MTDDPLARQLHDRVSRGEALSSAERAQLEAWYAHRDEEEARLLDGEPSASNVVTLRNQVQAALARLVAITQRIQTLAEENETLRQEITALQRQLPQSTTAQPV